MVGSFEIESPPTQIHKAQTFYSIHAKIIKVQCTTKSTRNPQLDYQNNSNNNVIFKEKFEKQT